MTTDILDQFEAAWSQGIVPNIVEFAARVVKSRRSSTVTELIQIDLERRWRSTNPSVAKRTTAAYLREFEMLVNRAQMIELICWEFHVRNRWGDFPQTASILAEWPQLSPELEQALGEVSDQLQRPTVSVIVNQNSIQVFVLDGVLEVGRQRINESPPIYVSETPNGSRLIIAESHDPTISRQQLSIRQTSESCVAIANTSRDRSIGISRHGVLDAGKQSVYEMPVRIVLLEALVLQIE